MANNTLYYTGKGVLLHKGKDIVFGAVLPEDLSEKTIASMLKKGTAAKSLPVASQHGETGVDSQLLAQINSERDHAAAQVIVLQEQLATVTDERDQATQALNEAQQNIAGLENTISEMTKAQLGGGEGVDKAAGATPAGAGPKK